ncbi:unnamed protein product [Rotaria magnacalcarata]|uniref:histone acetyltransferase n=1 Tax=Rotaria magnacalcarata TaxID=392030 RepID=A0A816YH52_9BILA|nr:unnamed protein product [Rotaria magnacalcarata]
MKNVLQQMTKCDDHKSCTVTDCVTSRQITLHWKQCKNSQCPICQPVKISSTLAKLNQAPTNNNNNNNNNSTTTVSLPINKEWQRHVTQEMRNHSVQKIITALIPITDIGAMRDKRIINLANYARCVESETRIQEELEERREKKRVQDMQLVMQPSSSTIHDFNARMNPDPITDDRMLLQIRTTTSLNDYLSSTASNSFQCTAKSESLMALTNVPSNESVSFLLNRDTTISSQAHDMDTKNSLDGNQFKKKAVSQGINHQSMQFSAHDSYSHLSTAVASTTVMIKSQSSTTDDTKQTPPQIDASSRQLPKHPVQFTADELREHLEPVIQKMLLIEDSHRFRQSVDPVALTILDYPTIVKNPMDISTMQDRLKRGLHKTPLEFCDDAWLMFNNAWIYNQKTARVYKMCTKRSDIFADAIDPVVQKLGYCCGRQYIYLPLVMFCYGNQLCCQISCEGNYYYYHNPEPSRINLSLDKYTLCSKCFDSVKSDSIYIGDDPTQTLVEIPKYLFLSSKNDIQEPEALIACTRHWHRVCALH